MSAIRPPVPSPLFPAQAPPSPARASRSDFFRAAIDGLKLPAEPEPPAKPKAAAPAPDDRIARPGSLLDIRI